MASLFVSEMADGRVGYRRSRSSNRALKNLECLQGRSPLQQLQCEGEWLERAWWAMEGKVAMGVAAAGAAAAIVCTTTCADEPSVAGGGSVVHIYRSPGLSPPKVVSTARTCAQFGITESDIMTVRAPAHLPHTVRAEAAGG